MGWGYGGVGGEGKNIMQNKANSQPVGAAAGICDLAELGNTVLICLFQGQHLAATMHKENGSHKNVIASQLHGED